MVRVQKLSKCWCQWRAAGGRRMPLASRQFHIKGKKYTTTASLDIFSIQNVENNFRSVSQVGQVRAEQLYLLTTTWAFLCPAAKYLLDKMLFLHYYYAVVDNLLYWTNSEYSCPLSQVCTPTWEQRWGLKWFANFSIWGQTGGLWHNEEFIQVGQHAKHIEYTDRISNKMLQ